MRFLVIGLAAAFCSLTTAFAQEEKSPWYEYYDVISYSELRALIDGGEVEEARILNDGWWVTVKLNGGEYFDVKVTPQTPIADHFYDAGIPVSIEHSSKDEDDKKPLWLDLFFNILPLLIFIFVFVFILWLMQKQGKKTQDECLDRARAINDEFLEKQQVQFDKFIEQFSSVMIEKNNG